MIIINEHNISMSETDFGQEIPLTFEGDILSTDEIRFSIKENICGEEIIGKEFKNLQVEDGVCKCALKFTKEDSGNMHDGFYVYGIALYRDNELKNTIVDSADFVVRRVVQK